jgi:hypothetical protein
MARIRRSGPSDAEQPDFASVYAGDEVVTPRLAAQLWGAAVYLSDTYCEDPQSELLMQELPPVAQRLADDAWLARFVSCFGALAVRLGAGLASEQLASCTADEMALHMVIDLAEGFAADGITAIGGRLPRRGRADTDFDWAREVLFRDHDVLMLFDVALDGIEDESGELTDQYRFANLHPRDWFTTFADVVDP